MADTASFLIRLKDQFTKPMRRAERASDKFGNSIKKTDKQLGHFIDKQGRARSASGKFVKGTGRLGGGIGSLGTKLGWAAAAYGAYKVAALGASGAMAIMDRSIKTENMENVLDIVAHDAPNAFKEVSGLAASFGLDIDQTLKSYSDFRKLQFGNEQSKQMIRLGADLQALGSTADDVQGIFRAMGQIKSKGKLQAEELLQLAERGVSGSLIKDEIAKLMGIARSEVESEQSKGNVSADVGLEAIERAMNVKLNQKKAGDSGKEWVANTMKGAVGAAKSQGQLLWIGLNKSAQGGIKKGVTGAMDALNNFTKSEAGARVMDTLNAAARGFGETMEWLLPGLVEIGGAALDGLLEGLGSLGDDFGVGIKDGKGWTEFIRNEVVPEVKRWATQLGTIASWLLAIAKLGIKAATGILTVSNALMLTDVDTDKLQIPELSKPGVDPVAGAPARDWSKGNGAASLNTKSGAAVFKSGANAVKHDTVVTAPITINVDGGDSPEATANATSAAFNQQIAGIFSRAREESAA